MELQRLRAVSLAGLEESKYGVRRLRSYGVMIDDLMVGVDIGLDTVSEGV